MKTRSSILIAFLFLCLTSQAQVIIAKWTFPTGSPSDSLADGGIPVNLDKALHTEGGTSPIDFTKNGASTKCAQATGWDNGEQLKCWVININTMGYENLKLSSKMQSGGNNPGPRDYVVQYRLGATGNWTEAPGTTIVTTNIWTDGKLDSVLLPAECSSQSALWLRWVMTTNTNSTGSTVTSNGINKFDDIYITGKMINTEVKENKKETMVRVTPNPSKGLFHVEAGEVISTISIFNHGGKCVYNDPSVHSKSINLKLDTIPSGTYFLKIRTISGKEGNQKIVIAKFP